MATILRDNIERHRREYNRPVRTIRHHRVRWLGYTEAARMLADLEVGMDTNFYSVKPFFFGYMAGSRRALRFVDTDGSIIPCFQLPTLWSEECVVHPSADFSLQLPIDKAVAETTSIIRRAAKEFFTPVPINSHPVSFATYSAPLVEPAWDAALDEGAPIVSADEWLDWTEARDEVRIQLDSKGCTLYSPRSLREVTVLFPPETSVQAEQGVLSRQVVWGQQYQAITLQNIVAGERRRIAF